MAFSSLAEIVQRFLRSPKSHRLRTVPEIKESNYDLV